MTPLPKQGSSTLLLAAISVANIAIGAALQLAGTWLVGAGAETDAYFAAQTLPLIVVAIASPALTNNLVPILVRVGRGSDRLLVKSVMRSATVPAILGAILLSSSAGLWVPFVFSGASEEMHSMTIALSPLMCGIFAANLLTSVAVAGYFARSRFLFVELIQLAVAACVLVLAVPVTEYFGIFGFASLLLVRSTAVGLILAMPFALVRGHTDPALQRELWGKASRIMSGAVIYKMGPAIDRIVASWAAPGVITSLSVGQQLITLATGVSDRALTRPLLVTASANHDGKSAGIVLRTYRHQLGLILALSVATAVLGLVWLAISPYMESQWLRVNLATLGYTDVIFLTASVALPTAAGALAAALMYGLGRVNSITRIAVSTFLLSTVVKVFGFYYVGTYAIIFGMFIYQALNWLLMHVESNRAMSSHQASQIHGDK